MIRAARKVAIEKSARQLLARISTISDCRSACPHQRGLDIVEAGAVTVRGTVIRVIT
jgi:hypothetical protein